MLLEPTVSLIHKFNKNWKHAKELWGDTHPTTTLMRDRKTDLQLSILLHHPEKVECKIEMDGSEDVVAISLIKPFKYQDVTYNDAAHIPLRLAQSFIPYKQQGNTHGNY